LDSIGNWFFFILGIGFYYLIDKTLTSIRPRYLESVEESINDTAHLFSSLVELELINQKKTNFQSNQQKLDHFSTTVESTLDPIFKKVKTHSFQAKIYKLIKTNVDIQIYVTNQQGIVIYDSEYFRKGLDYSKFNDVVLTLQNKYGARSSKLHGEEDEGALFVAAPIIYNQKIMGVLTIIKPKSSIIPFIESAREKFWEMSLIIAISISLFFLILLYGTVAPIRKLSKYIVSIREGERPTFPKIAIPEIKELGLEMDHLIGELEGKNYIENYLQTFTHEIKSPLTTIIASSELLMDDTVIDSNKSITLFRNIQKESLRIQEIIDRLLELSSLENTKTLNLNQTIDLNRFLSEINDTFFAEKEKYNLILDHELSYDLPTISANEFYLKLAFQNLFRNAYDFAKDGSRIRLHTYLDSQNHIVVEIYNDTEPIPDYALSRLMERFYSLPRLRTGRKSSGLGLALVKQVLNFHNAKISIENFENGVLAKVIFF
jgi:two-component system sensor histidine kinase CreC